MNVLSLRRQDFNIITARPLSAVVGQFLLTAAPVGPNPQLSVCIRDLVPVREVAGLPRSVTTPTGHGGWTRHGAGPGMRIAGQGL